MPPDRSQQPCRATVDGNVFFLGCCSCANKTHLHLRLAQVQVVVQTMLLLLLQVQLLSSQTTATARQAGGLTDIVKQTIEGFTGPNHQNKIRSCQVLLKTARLPRDMLSSFPMRSPRLRELTSYGLPVSYRLLTMLCVL
jgi:hypothetical protein